MPQDDVSRMSKKQLERAVRAARAEEKHALAQQQVQAIGDYEAGQIDGWNQLVMLVSTQYEPLMNATNNVEILVAEIRDAVLFAQAGNRLNHIKQPLEERAVAIGAWLAKADPHNRAMAATVGDDKDFIDFSYAQALRDAVLNFKNGRDPGGSALLQVVRQHALAQRYSSIEKAMKQTRQRPETAPRDVFGPQVQRLINDGKKPVEAIGLVFQEYVARKRADETNYALSTIKSYYYEWAKKNSKSVVVS